MAIVHVTSENYEKEVLQSDKPVLIDFWASWCGPCQMLGPVIEEVSEEVTDVKFVKVSTEELVNMPFAVIVLASDTAHRYLYST